MMNNFYFRTKLFLPSWPKNLPHKRALSVWDCLALVTEYPQIFRMMRVILLVCTCLVNTGLYRKILVAVQSLILLMQFIFYESFWFEKLPSSHLVMNNAFHRGTDFKHLKVAAVSLLMKLQFFSSDQITVQALYSNRYIHSQFLINRLTCCWNLFLAKKGSHDFNRKTIGNSAAVSQTADKNYFFGETEIKISLQLWRQMSKNCLLVLIFYICFILKQYIHRLGNNIPSSMVTGEQYKYIIVCTLPSGLKIVKIAILLHTRYT